MTNETQDLINELIRLGFSEVAETIEKMIDSGLWSLEDIENLSDMYLSTTENRCLV